MGEYDNDSTSYHVTRYSMTQGTDLFSPVRVRPVGAGQSDRDGALSSGAGVATDERTQLPAAGFELQKDS